MLRATKAEGLSFNVIILAVLALVVLIVLIVIFTGRANIFFTALNDCDSKPGSKGCQASCASGYAPVPGTDCNDNGQVCCVQVIPDRAST